MHSYPIWNDVQACIYKNGSNGAKSYGVKNEGVVNVKIGTSKSNSHEFLTHCTTTKKYEDGTREYRFYVDSKLVKRAFVKDGEMFKRLKGYA
jgi:hypothetical protein